MKWVTVIARQDTQVNMKHFFIISTVKWMHSIVAYGYLGATIPDRELPSDYLARFVGYQNIYYYLV